MFENNDEVWDTTICTYALQYTHRTLSYSTNVTVIHKNWGW